MPLLSRHLWVAIAFSLSANKDADTDIQLFHIIIELFQIWQYKIKNVYIYESSQTVEE